MPASAIVHAAVFTAGALLGGGIATAVASKKATQPTAAIAYPVRPPPVVVVDDFGKASISKDTSVVSSLPLVLKHGNPGPVSDLLIRKAYTAGYDRRLRHPSWTAEHLTAASLGRSAIALPSSEEAVGDRSKSAFIEDQSIPSLFRAKLQDYFRSGYDRGHMVPAADAKISQEAMNETFLLTNIAPQVGDGFNRHYWAYLEDWCRRLTGTFQDVYVFTVPLYLPKKDMDGRWRVTHEVIGNPPNVSVPTHFAKVVLASKPKSPSTPDIVELSSGAFVLPNAIIPDEAPLESFVVPVEAVERAAGITLFSESVKTSSRHICQSTRCEVVVRRFDDAQKKAKKAIAAPRS